MSMFIIPNDLRDEIYRVVDEQLIDHPEAKEGREDIYQQLLSYYAEHGVIPEFTIGTPQQTLEAGDENATDGSQAA